MTTNVSCWYDARVGSLWGADFGERTVSPIIQGRSPSKPVEVVAWCYARETSLWGTDFGERVHSPPSDGQEVNVLV